ncbi:hypothetical protein [Streptomyces neyagawaensis]|uniref:hypothetical protein n=1 Tax=Streptomyces neyagawaensis TaxID=42238 RepID=UPI00201CB763|nr:hypothetical protein [Streptomyces neyagawaensis]MCL6732923.1 hypothetical protein [Streptomyces neyagawaensis]MDE1684784.1 hypothetical protein [Streptomyces neyagawaensis]
MSWDVYVYRFPHEAQSPADIEDGWEPPVIGTGREVRAALAGVLPGITFGEDGWGEYAGPGFSLSTTTTAADDTPVTGVGLIFHGGGEGAVRAALAVMDVLGARAVETGSGGFLNPESGLSSFEAWQAYRDGVLRGS